MLVAVGGLVAAAVAGPALAACYDILGCTNQNLFSKNYAYLASVADGPNCDFLYTMRNDIYAEHGYCFVTARAKAEIGDTGCHITNMAAVPLSKIEIANIATIAKAEKAKACPP